MKVAIITSSYDSGLSEVRMGRGPRKILDAGLVERLESEGHDVVVEAADPKIDFPAEVASAFAVMAAVGSAVAKAEREQRFPLVLAGNCNTTVGVVSGLSPRRAGVVWFDGHADLETPETTTTGFLDGMGLAILTGQCWRSMAGKVPGFTPIAGENAILAGASDVGTEERGLLERSGMTFLPDTALKETAGHQRLAAALDRLAGRVEGIHLHIDLDVHDPRVAQANHYRPPGGLTPEQLRGLVETLVARIPIFSAAITAYDPAYDSDGAILQSCLAIVGSILGHVRPNTAAQDSSTP